jgi:hypothetical protein
MTGRRQDAGKDSRGLQLKRLGLRNECLKTINTEQLTYFNSCCKSPDYDTQHST